MAEASESDGEVEKIEFADVCSCSSSRLSCPVTLVASALSVGGGGRAAVGAGGAGGSLACALREAVGRGEMARIAAFSSHSPVGASTMGEREAGCAPLMPDDDVEGVKGWLRVLPALPLPLRARPSGV